MLTFAALVRPTCRSIFFEEDIVQIARNRFGYGVVGHCARVLVFAGIQQRLDGFALFAFRKPVPSLFDRELLPDIVFGEAESRDRSASFRCCFPLQNFRRIRE